jgi:ABC-type sugar transport system ATPase subunit
MSRNLIQLEDVSKSYGHVRALEGVSLTVREGETHALVGDNGAGKSTLIKILAGDIRPTSGSVKLNGQKVSFNSPVEAMRAGISTVYQNLALVGCRTISENLFLGREPTRFGFVRRKFMRDHAMEMLSSLRQMNVTDPNALVDSLSGGQRQAVAIARGVQLASNVLILDEPTAALGVRETRSVLDLIAELKGQHKTIILVSHNFAEVLELADRVTVLRAGRILETRTASELTGQDVVALITGAVADPGMAP